MEARSRFSPGHAMDGRPLTPLMYVSAPASRGETVCQKKLSARQEMPAVGGQALPGPRAHEQGRYIEFEKDWRASKAPVCLQSRPSQPGQVPYVHSAPGWVSWPRVWPQWTLEKCGLWSLHKSKHSLATAGGRAERSSSRHRVLSAGMRHATCKMQHGE